MHAVILLLSHSDTDLLSARAATAAVAARSPTGTPTLPAAPGRPPGLLDGADLVVVRLLGGVRAWEEGIEALRAQDRPVVVLTGEQAPDAQR